MHTRKYRDIFETDQKRDRQKIYKAPSDPRLY